MSTNVSVSGYSALQVTLHWTIVVLVAFQFLAHDAIEDTWRAYSGGETTPSGKVPMVYLHIGVGVLVLVLMAVRVWARLSRGAPPPPADEPRLLQIVSEAVHGAIYVLLILLPLSGLVAWFAGSPLTAQAHSLMTTLLLAAIALHIAGALFQHLVRRSQVMMRMFQPERR